jgi:hypothetical protein
VVVKVRSDAVEEICAISPNPKCLTEEIQDSRHFVETIMILINVINVLCTSRGTDLWRQSEIYTSNRKH